MNAIDSRLSGNRGAMAGTDSGMYVERCRQFAKAAQPAEWDGVWSLSAK